MPNIPNATSELDTVYFYYGPTYVLSLPEAFPLSGLRNFSVQMELNNSDPAYVGEVHVGLLDGLQSAVIMAKLRSASYLSNTCEFRWTYNVRNKTPHNYGEFEPDYLRYYMSDDRPMDFVNSTWSSTFNPALGLNGSIPAFENRSRMDRTFIPLEEVETARSIRHLFLTFGGRYQQERYSTLPPVRVHDIYLEYEVGGVIDTTPPSLNDVRNIEYILGQTGNTIIWNCSDDNPDRYWLMDYRNLLPQSDVNRSSGLWNGSSFTISADGLDVGTRYFELYVEDKAGFMVWDYVEVTVIEYPVVAFMRSIVFFILSNILIVGIAGFILFVYVMEFRNRKIEPS
ncbi:MAG: hypothetical protein RTV41_02390 [Candidatus Thorarchaeota archaeon]